MSREWLWLYRMSQRWKWLDRELLRWFPAWWMEIYLFHALRDEVTAEINREIIAAIKKQMEAK